MPIDKKIINLGCGQKIIDGAINIDRIPFPGVDFVIDFVKYGIPDKYKDVDEVVADYVLTQIADKEDFINVMNSVWNVLKPGGLFKIKVPDARHPDTDSFNDPMDCRYFTEETFDYFNKDHYRFFAFNYGFKGWEIVSIDKERENRLYVVMKKPL